ncbi:MAG: hypothetical protein WCV62_05765 [Candidatus Peribacteraceae bacterium]|jgi:hypothetical protein
MTVTKTDLKVLSNEVTCVVSVVESGVGYLYFGTDKGVVRKYNMASGALTDIRDVGEKVLSLTLYSGTLYIGLAGGKLISLTTS